MDILELFGVEETPEQLLPEDPRAQVELLLAPDFAFRLHMQHEVEDAILRMYSKAKPSSKPKVPPPVQMTDGTIDRAALTERWHVVRELGRSVSDERVTELLEDGQRKITAHETARRTRAEELLEQLER